MRYAYFGLGMILFGSIGLVTIMMFESLTIDNDSEYYVLKEAQEAAMIESVDLACYRSSEVIRNDDATPKRDEDGNYTYVGCNGEKLKISEQKFVENFTRRFAQSVSGDVASYTIEFKDIIESPPKATVIITSHNKNYKFFTKEDDLNVVNNLSGILEFNYNTESDNVKNASLILKPGDYVKMEPAMDSFTPDKDMTGSKNNTPINLKELNIWRVIKIDKNSGKVDVISDKVSSVNVEFGGETGYKNAVGYLNTLAKKYQNGTYTSGSRYFGYSNQTKKLSSMPSGNNTAPWICSTGKSCNPTESEGGGDIGYLVDYNLVKNAGVDINGFPPGSSTSVTYWLASRYYVYNSASDWRFAIRTGGLSGASMFFGNSHQSQYVAYALRPIVVLKPNLTIISGDGKSPDTAYTFSPS